MTAEDFLGVETNLGMCVEVHGRFSQSVIGEDRMFISVTVNQDGEMIEYTVEEFKESME